MVFCTDKGVRYLANLGYNVVRHPYVGLVPTSVIGSGKRGGETEWLGDLPDLVKESSATLPAPDGPVQAADVIGKASSAMNFRVGAGALSSFLGALGGVLDVSAKYTNARTIQFLFRDVEKLQVAPAKVAEYVEAGRLRWDSMLFGPYLEGDGRLLVVTAVLTAKSVTVLYERTDGVGAKVQVPVLQDLVGAKVSVSASAERSHEITYRGDRNVAFGFKCFEFGFQDGSPKLVGVGPGGVFLDLSGEAGGEGSVVLTTQGEPLLDLHRAS